MFKTLLESLGQILIMVCLGFCLEKNHLLGGRETKDSLTRLLVDVLTPFNILSSCAREFSSEAGREVFLCIGMSIVYYVSSLVFCCCFFTMVHIDDHKRGVAITSSVFANTAFIGYPIVTSLFGSEGILFGSAFGIGYSLFMFTFGVRFLSGKRQSANLKALISPNLVAVILSNIIYFSPYRLPHFVNSCISSLGSTTVPLSMFLIGATFVGVSFKSMFSDGYAYLVALVRLMFIPLCLILTFKLMPCLSLKTKQICVLIASAPVGSFNVILSQRYGGNADFANKGLCISMLFSIFTIPLMFSLV